MRRVDAALFAIVVAGAGLRFGSLDAQSWWRDEASTVFLLRDDLGGLLSAVADREAMPPLYFVLAWLWTRVAGTGEVGIRSLSALIGVCTIPVAFWLGKRLAGERAGLIAAALVAFNPFLIWFSQEARPYALLVLLTSIATVFWLQAVTETDRRASLWWGVFGGLALLAHYFAAFLLVPQAVVLLWRARREAWAGLAVLAATALALVPLVLAQRDSRVDWVGLTPLRERVTDVAKHWVAGPFGSPVDIVVALAALVFAAGVVLAVARPPRQGALLVGGCAAVAAVLPVAVALIGPDYVFDRYLIASLVPLLAVAALGFARISTGGLVAATALAGLFAACTLTWTFDAELHREDWRAAAARIDGGSAVVTSPPGDAPLRVYLPSARPASAAASFRTVYYVAPWRFGKPRPANPAATKPRVHPALASRTADGHPRGVPRPEPGRADPHGPRGGNAHAERSLGHPCRALMGGARPARATSYTGASRQSPRVRGGLEVGARALRSPPRASR